MKAPQPSLRPGTRQILLSFPGQDLLRNAPHSLHSTYLNRPFLPLGLLFWGATDETFVTGVRVGNQRDLDASSVGTRIPARYFEAGKTFAELSALADVGELQGAVELRQLLQLGEVYSGNQVNVEVEGPFESFCMWGLTSDGQAPMLVRVQKQVKSGPLRLEEPPLESWLGEVIRRELAGDRVTFEVEGPSPEVVSGLIAAFMVQP